MIGDNAHELSLLLGENNALQSGSFDTFAFDLDVDLGEIKCIELDAMGEDAWRFKYIWVSTGNSEVYFFSNAADVWMSSDTTEGSNRLKLCRNSSNSHTGLTNTISWNMTLVS